MKDLPSVCIAGFHSCIRAYKFGLALKERGHKVYWLANLRFPTHVSLHVFDGISAYCLGDNVESIGPSASSNYFDSFKKNAEMVSKHVDVFHWYNEPDWGVEQLKQVTDKPVLYDIHDLRSDREFVVQDEEEIAFTKADAILTQGEPYSAIARQKRPDLAAKGLIDHCYPAVNRTLWPNLDYRGLSIGAKKIGGLVYEGGIATGKAGGNELRFRWWYPFMKELSDLHIPISVHPSGGGDFGLYAQQGIRIVAPMDYKTLLQNLTMYDWGLVGNAIKHPAFDKAMPNKLFEYIAAGIPVIVYDSKLAAEFVKAEGIGVVVDSAKDVPAVFPDAMKYVPAVLKAREKYCMENEISKLSNIYCKLVGK